MALFLLSLLTLLSSAADCQPYKGDCYVFNSVPATFFDVEDSCVQQGGHLASIYSNDDRGVVSSLDLHDGHAWTTHRQQWIYTDGTSFDYEAWTYHEPAGPCAILDSGGNFRGCACNMLITSVCRIPVAADAALKV